MTGQSTGCLPAAAFRHDALFYDDSARLTEVAVPFLLDGLASGDATVIVTGPATASVLREAVDDNPLVQVLDRRAVYRSRTPAAIVAFRRLAEQHAPDGGRRVRVIGEVDHGRAERDWHEWQRYEAVINEALAPWPLWGLCLFDTRRLPAPLLASAARTHPSLAGPADRRPNPSFIDPAEYLRSLPAPAEPLEGTPPRLHAGSVTDFIGLRHAVAGELATVPAPRDVVEDFLLATDEMTSNALRHGTPPVSLTLWVGADRMVCRVRDRGPGWDDPFAGYGPAHGDDLSRGGMGLWLARQLCDHVDITTDAEGTSVRLTTRLG